MTVMEERVSDGPPRTLAWIFSGQFSASAVNPSKVRDPITSVTGHHVDGDQAIQALTNLRDIFCSSAPQQKYLVRRVWTQLPPPCLLLTRETPCVTVAHSHCFREWDSVCSIAGEGGKVLGTTVQICIYLCLYVSMRVQYCFRSVFGLVMTDRTTFFSFSGNTTALM